MKKKRYKFNPQTLTYEVISIPFRIRFYRILRKILIGFILASIVNLLFSFFFYTPKMYHIEEQNNELLLKYDILNDKIHAATVKLQELRHRDNNVYRPLFAADSLTIQGVYTEYPDVKYSDMQGDLYTMEMVGTWKSLDAMSRLLYLESKSLDELENRMRAQGMRMSEACITSDNAGSVAFHERHGYRVCGEQHTCGYKFGRWYDMVWMEKILGAHPERPLEVVPFSELLERGAVLELLQ